jgi:hypothetical protein
MVAVASGASHDVGPKGGEAPRREHVGASGPHAEKKYHLTP